MNIFSVSFFGHRQIDNPLQIESQLEEIISSLLQREEYIEFLVGRDGEFDQHVSSTIRRRKRRIRDDNSAFFTGKIPYRRSMLFFSVTEKV